MTEIIILFGTNSAIAQAYITHLQKTDLQAEIICISRAKPCQSYFNKPNISYYESDYSDGSLRQIIESVSNDKTSPRKLSQVIIFNGILHRAI